MSWDDAVLTDCPGCLMGWPVREDRYGVVHLVPKDEREFYDHIYRCCDWDRDA